MIITWQTIITLAAVLTALATILRYYNKGYDMAKHQPEQDEAIEKLSERHEADEKRRDELREEDRKQMNGELQLLTYGVLACLKGLKEQGCNGPVTEAINKLEKHLNEKAHS
jgi:hypothetical protein